MFSGGVVFLGAVLLGAILFRPTQTPTPTVMLETDVTEPPAKTETMAQALEALPAPPALTQLLSERFENERAAEAVAVTTQLATLFEHQAKDTQQLVTLAKDHSDQWCMVGSALLHEVQTLTPAAAVAQYREALLEERPARASSDLARAPEELPLWSEWLIRLAESAESKKEKKRVAAFQESLNESSDRYESAVTTALDRFYAQVDMGVNQRFPQTWMPDSALVTALAACASNHQPTDVDWKQRETLSVSWARAAEVRRVAVAAIPETFAVLAKAAQKTLDPMVAAEQSAWQLAITALQSTQNSQ